MNLFFGFEISNLLKDLIRDYEMRVISVKYYNILNLVLAFGRSQSRSVIFWKRPIKMVSVTEITVTVVAYLLRPISLNDRLKWPIHIFDRSLSDRKFGYHIFGYRIFGNRIYFQNLNRSEKRLVKFDRVFKWPVRKDRTNFLSVALGHVRSLSIN